MVDNTESKGKVTNGSDLLPVIAVVFSILALAIFLYVFFGDVEKELKADAIYWFLIALAAAMLPHVRQIRFRDLELNLREEIEKGREEIESRIDDLQTFTDALSEVALKESELPPELRQHRNRVFRDFNQRLQRMGPDQRLKLQERHTRMHATRLNITLSDAKKALAELDLYHGDISNEFDSETAEAIRRFQERNGIEPDGILGPMTCDRLFSRLRQSSD